MAWDRIGSGRSVNATEIGARLVSSGPPSRAVRADLPNAVQCSARGNCGGGGAARHGTRTPQSAASLRLDYSNNWQLTACLCLTLLFASAHSPREMREKWREEKREGRRTEAPAAASTNPSEVCRVLNRASQ